MPTPLMKSLAKKAGTSTAKVEKMWDSVKQSLKDQGASENDPNFYARVVGIIKKNLGLKEEYEIHEKFRRLLEENFVINPQKHKDLIEYWTDYRFPSGPNRSRTSDMAKKNAYEEMKSLGFGSTSEQIDVAYALDRYVKF